jgi:hypothetical protein
MAPKWAAWEASNATKAWKTPRESKRARAPKKAKDGTLVVLPKKKSRPQPRAASAAPDPAMPAPPAHSPTSPKLAQATRDDFSNILALRAGINRFVYGMLPGVSQKVSRRVLVCSSTI